MSSPTVSYIDLTYTITLFRPDATGLMKEKKYIFGEHKLEVCASHESDLASWERSQMKGGPAEDGLIYYLCAQPEDIGILTFIWLKNKEEAEALRKAIKDAEDDLYSHYNEDTPCSFCGEMYSFCGGDHCDEMRQIQREALKHDY
jgi:hypothetical protein